MNFKQNSSFVKAPRVEDDQSGNHFGKFSTAHRLIDTKTMQKNLANSLSVQ